MNDFFRIDADADTGVAELVLNRPDRMNTMAPAFFPALRDAVQALDDAGATRALIVRGEGKHFSAGVALDTFAPDGAMQRLQRLLPQGLARELAYTGDRLGAERALEFYPRRGYSNLGMTVYTIDGEAFPNHLFGKRVRHVAPA